MQTLKFTDSSKKQKKKKTLELIYLIKIIKQQVRIHSLQVFFFFRRKVLQA